MESIKFEVPGISCGHCVAKIENTLQSEAGVSGVWANAHQRSVEVEFGPPLTEERLKELLAEINYPVSG
jgi:copper chaperone CopZ